MTGTVFNNVVKLLGGGSSYINWVEQNEQRDKGMDT